MGSEQTRERLAHLLQFFDQEREHVAAIFIGRMELEIDMILGQDFLAGYSLLIDYRHRTITFLK